MRDFKAEFDAAKELPFMDAMLKAELLAAERKKLEEEQQTFDPLAHEQCK